MPGDLIRGFLCHRGGSKWVPWQLFIDVSLKFIRFFIEELTPYI
jgi:hypothetical protein